jgi:hypothetical protein
MNFPKVQSFYIFLSGPEKISATRFFFCCLLLSGQSYASQDSFGNVLILAKSCPLLFTKTKFNE